MKEFAKTLLLMYALTAGFVSLLAFMLQKMELSKGALSIGTGAVCVLSCFAGGFLTGKFRKSRKFLWGLLMGALYLAVMLCAALLVKHGFLSGVSGIFLNAALCLGGGMLGGMFA